LKVTVSVPDVAVSEFAPGVLPSVHPPALAIPDASVVADPVATEPPPETTLNVTTAPGNGAPFWSRTITEGVGETAVPALADSVVSEFATSVVATRGSAGRSPLQLADPMSSIAGTNFNLRTTNDFT
jgi:hypothetical protein